MKRLLLLLIVIFIWWCSTKQQKIDTNQKLWEFKEQIEQYEQILAWSGCKAWESYFLWLSQDYKYIHQYQKAIDILNKLADCYPGAYKEKTSKLKLLLNNAWVVYEEWAYYLKQNWNPDYKNKYVKARQSFETLMQLFSGTKLLTEEEINSYRERMKYYK